MNCGYLKSNTFCSNQHDQFGMMENIQPAVHNHEPQTATSSHDIVQEYFNLQPGASKLENFYAFCFCYMQSFSFNQV